METLFTYVWNENVDFQAKYKYMRVPTKHALNTHRSVMQIGQNMDKDEKVDKVITNVIWRKRKKDSIYHYFVRIEIL